MPDGFTLPMLTIGTPFVGSAPSPYQLDSFTIGSAPSGNCPGCASNPVTSAAQVYPALQSSFSSNASPAGGLVDVNVDTSPLLILGAIWLFFTFAKGK